MYSFSFLIAEILGLAVYIYILIIILQVVMSWLIAFDVVNSNNDQAKNLMNLLKKATDPVFNPIRKYIPPIGGIDLTPLVVIIGLQILMKIVYSLLFSF